MDIAESPPEKDATTPLYNILVGNYTTSTPVLANNRTVNSCDTIDANYDIPTSVICAMCFVFGIIYTFFGKL